MTSWLQKGELVSQPFDFSVRSTAEPLSHSAGTVIKYKPFVSSIKNSALLNQQTGAVERRLHGMTGMLPRLLRKNRWMKAPTSRILPWGPHTCAPPHTLVHALVLCPPCVGLLGQAARKLVFGACEFSCLSMSWLVAGQTEPSA